ncbi:hypothetical protein BH09PSE6_BH09PSE6_23020 [soil metagenome]
MSYLRMFAALGIAAGASVSLGACAELGDVKPWEKANLAKPAMMMDSGPLETRYEEHIQFSKEGSTGGNGVGGGGCGCN